jgi:hypothetical protein
VFYLRRAKLCHQSTPNKKLSKLPNGLSGRNLQPQVQNPATDKKRFIVGKKRTLQHLLQITLKLNFLQSFHVYDIGRFLFELSETPR